MDDDQANQPDHEPQLDPSGPVTEDSGRHLSRSSQQAGLPPGSLPRERTWANPGCQLSGWPGRIRCHTHRSIRGARTIKAVNPQWRNPRTGEFFYSDDPKNPIGERWIGIKGIDQTNNELLGYGIHGTIDEASIGQMQSMGCIRMNDADVKLVYDALTERGSIIEIVP